MTATRINPTYYNTRVKGNAENAYRTGDVNLTPANIGAAAASHNHAYKLITATKAYSLAAGNNTTVTLNPSVPSGYNAVAVKRVTSGAGSVAITGYNVSSNTSWDVSLTNKGGSAASATVTMIAVCLPSGWLS